MAAAFKAAWPVLTGAIILLITILVVVQLPCAYPVLILLSCHLLNPSLPPLSRGLHITITVSTWANFLLNLVPFILHQNRARSCDLACCLALALMVHVRLFQLTPTKEVDVQEPMLELVASTTPSKCGSPKEGASEAGSASRRRWKLAWFCFCFIGLSLTITSVSKFLDFAFTVSGIFASSVVSYGFTQSSPSVFYTCSGLAASRAIVVLEGGFTLPASGMAHIRSSLAFSSSLRVCVLAPLGTGWSEAGRDYGFIEDAEMIQAVVDEEIEKAGWEKEETRVFVGGHSRGHITGATFLQRHSEGYAKVTLLGFDGTPCGPLSVTPLSEMENFKYAVAVFGWGGGYIRLLWPFLGYKAQTSPGEDVAEGTRADLGPADDLRYLETIVDEEFLRSSIERTRSWDSEFTYDGPTRYECSDLGVHCCTQWDSGDYDEHIFVSKVQTCMSGECAGHTSMVTVGKFARVAAGRVGERVKEMIEELDA